MIRWRDNNGKQVKPDVRDVGNGVYGQNLGLTGCLRELYLIVNQDLVADANCPSI
jgi:hypothetical protein